MTTLPDYLAFKAERMARLRARLAQPEAQPFSLEATARVAGGSGVRPVRVREFTIVTDSGPALAGYDLGPTAPELLLCSLASCLAHTFLIIAAARGVQYDALEVTVRGTIDFRGVLEVDPNAPIAPQGLRYEARISSPASDTELAAIQQEVERLCPVLQALTRPTAVEGVVVRR
jgi:uncharacterized OsmC-like protein